MQPQPTSNPGNFTNPAVPTNTATGDIVLDAGKKKRKNLLIGLLVAAILLGGGGAFAAMAIIANQPQNIIASSIGNFFSAEQVNVDGTINLDIKNSEFMGLNSATLTLDSQNSSASGSSATATLQLDIPSISNVPTLNFSEVFLSDGVLYLKADGIKNLYDEVAYGNYYNTIMSQVQAQYQYQAVDECTATATDPEVMYKCYDLYDAELTPEAAESISNVATGILNQIGDAINSIDGQWVEISLDGILSSELTASLDTATRQTITTAYNCAVDTINTLPDYSGELSDLYNKNPFINMTANGDFYDITLEAEPLANYLNATPQTNLVKDFVTCAGGTVPDDATLGITTDSAAYFVDYLPQISAKFDGFLSHHLTELKINEQQNYFSLTSDLKFTYPSASTFTAPSDARPVMDVVEDVYQKIQSIEGVYTL